MQRDRGIISFSHPGDLMRFGDSASVRNIWLNNVDYPGLKEPFEIPSAIQAFSKRNGCRGMMRNLDQCFQMLGENRFFDEHQSERIEFPHQSFSHGSMDSAMKIDGDPKIITDRISYRADTRDNLVQFARRIDIVKFRACVHLYRLISLRLPLLNGVHYFCWFIATDPSIDLHPVSHFTA